MITKKPVGYIKDAIFLSHTSLNDFLNCPKAYYLKNVYRNPESGYKIQAVSPYLALGAVVHDVIKWYFEAEDKPTKVEVENKFRGFWWKFHGKRGGFTSSEEEAGFGKRGLLMLENFLTNVTKVEKPLSPIEFPKYLLTENIVLHGNMDYAGELSDGTLHVMDFKTGSKDEVSPLQLYIYSILAENYYGKPVSKASFWYLDRDDAPKEIVMDPLQPQIDWLTEKGLMLKKALEENCWECIRGEDLCRDCRDYTAILEGKGELMFVDHAFKKEVYFLPRDN